MNGKKLKEVYQEYPTFTVYKVYLINGDSKTFLYTETESKIKTKVDINKELKDEDKQLWLFRGS